MADSSADVIWGHFEDSADLGLQYLWQEKLVILPHLMQI
jgi:hypothetical protein